MFYKQRGALDMESIFSFGEDGSTAEFNERRRLMKLIVAASGVAALGEVGVLSAAGAKGQAEYIDSHVHVWTPDTRKYPLSVNFSETDMVPKSFTPEQLLVYTKENSVGKVVLVQMNFYEYDNSYMTDCIAAFPGVFAGIGIVDHTQSNVVSEMRRLGKLGVRGFRLYATKEAVGKWGTDEGIQQMWNEGQRSGQAMCLLSDPESIPGISRMCEKYPESRVVIDHFSRIGMRGAIDPGHLDQLCQLAKHKNVFLKTSAFYALGAKKAPYTDLISMIDRVVEEFGASRLMWGSDCPYQVEEGHRYEDSIELIRTRMASLSDEDRSWMLGRTAQQVFFS